jgi:hypothetical protein
MSNVVLPVRTTMRYSSGDRAPEYSNKNKRSMQSIDRKYGMHEIVGLVLWSTPEVRRVKSGMVDSCEKRLSITLKRPVDINKTRICLTKDDMELWVTICHIRRSRFRTGAHIFDRLARFCCHCCNC